MARTSKVALAFFLQKSLALQSMTTYNREKELHAMTTIKEVSYDRENHI